MFNILQLKIQICNFFQKNWDFSITIREHHFLIYYKFVLKNLKNISNTQKETEFHVKSIVVFIYNFWINF